MTRIIAVANQKGGVGKTTTVANLGVAFARKKKKTLVVDLDPQGALTAGFGFVGVGRTRYTGVPVMLALTNGRWLPPVAARTSSRIAPPSI